MKPVSKYSKRCFVNIMSFKSWDIKTYIFNADLFREVKIYFQAMYNKPDI